MNETGGDVPEGSLTMNTLGQEQSVGRQGKGWFWFYKRIRIFFRDIEDQDVGCLTPGLDHDICRLVMCMNGDMRICLVGREPFDDVELTAGHCSLHYHPAGCRCMNCAYCRRVQVLELEAPTGDFLSLIGETDLGKKLEEAVVKSRPFAVRKGMSPPLCQALATLKDAVTDSGGGGTPLILSRALEILWLFSTAHESAVEKPLPDDIRRPLVKARLLLEQHMSEPPSLEDLAGQVGMSLTRFKEMFPRMFGMTPYAYLRILRMERARHLLGQGTMTVTEAAFDVGYSNLSHFSKTFTEHFGVQPSRMARKK